MMKESQLRFGALSLALTLGTACAASSQAPVEQPAPASRMETQTGGRNDVVKQEELWEVRDVGTAFDALRKLRPEFLTRRAAAVPTDPYEGHPVVYLDGQRLGDLSTLRGIPLRTIIEIRFLRMAAAAQQLGLTHPGGVIAVSTQR
jgi:hypothetical protein